MTSIHAYPAFAGDAPSHEHVLEDPRIRAIVDDIAHSMKYSLVVAASGADMHEAGTLDRAFRAALTSLPSDERLTVQKKAADYLKAPATVRARFFGRYGNIEPEAYARVGSDKVAELLGGLRIPTLRRSLTRQPTSAEASSLEVSAGIGGTRSATLSKLQLWIDKVYCLGESQELGLNRSDEINMAAIAVSPSGKTQKIKEFVVSSDFDAGETVKPNKLLVEFNLDEGGDLWPKSFGVDLLMAEKDYGGFSKVIDHVWESVESEVKKKVAAAIATGVATAVGAVIGNALGAIIAAVLSAIIEFLARLARDDVFEPQTLLFRVGSKRTDILEKQGYVPGLKLRVDFKMDGVFNSTCYAVFCRAVCK